MAAWKNYRKNEADLMECPIAGNFEVSMTKKGFLNACKKNRSTRRPICIDHCKIRNQIEKDKKFTPPKGITFLSITKLSSGSDEMKEVLKGNVKSTNKKLMSCPQCGCAVHRGVKICTTCHNLNKLKEEDSK